jgi:hypothetical protein
MTLEKYFNIIESLLDHHWAILERQLEYIRFSEWRGKIDGRIVSYDGSFIDAYEEIIVVKNSLIKGRYAYQYMKNHQVFRYDNYPNHPGISSPFHHKHTSKGVIQLEVAPKLAEIIEEAVRYISYELP